MTLLKNILLVLMLNYSALVFSQGKKGEFVLKTDTISTAMFRSDQSYLQNYYHKVNSLFKINYYNGAPLKKTPSSLVYFNGGEEIEREKKLGWNSLDRRILGIRFITPNALRYYLDSSSVQANCNNSNLIYYSFNKKDFTQVYRPFYFSKSEVSNKEYREFLNYIIDSLFRKELGGEYITVLGKDTIINREIKLDINLPENVDKLQKFYLLENERFYKNRQINTKNYNYPFKGKNLAVYPDTATWVNDFSYSFNEPMLFLYFWHPVYDDYPVVGITYWQAKAFCEWKTKQLQKEWSKINPDIIIEVDLPTMIEREYVIQKSTQFATDEYRGQEFYAQDNGFTTDLLIQQKDLLYKPKRYLPQEYRPLRANLYRNAITKGNFVMDGSLHTIPMLTKTNYPLATTLEKTNSKDIHYLGNNVSEWTSHDYSQWKAIFIKRQEVLLNNKTEEDSLVSKIEMMYDRENDKNGKLVIGGNWFDERHSLELGQPLDGAYAKRFVHPDSAHCTIGFRYVVRVKLKNDSNQLNEVIGGNELPDNNKWKINIQQLVNNCDRWVIDSITDDRITLKLKSTNDTDNALCKYVDQINCEKASISFKDIPHKYFIKIGNQSINNDSDITILDGVYAPVHYENAYKIKEIYDNKIVLYLVR